MMRLALAFSGFLIYFIQAQLLPTIFHTNWLPNLILTIIVMITLFKGRRMGLISAVVGGIVHDVLISNFWAPSIPLRNCGISTICRKASYL